MVYAVSSQEYGNYLMKPAESINIATILSEVHQEQNPGVHFFVANMSTTGQVTFLVLPVPPMASANSL